MNFIDSGELLSFLNKLKSSNWLVDKNDLITIMKIVEWHELIYGESDVKDIRDEELYLCRLTGELCNYIKITIGNKYKKCLYCHNIKNIDQFLKKTKKGKQIETLGCKICLQIKKEYQNKLYNHTWVRPVTKKICSQCDEECESAWNTCDECRIYNRNKYHKHIKKKKNNI